MCVSFSSPRRQPVTSAAPAPDGTAPFRWGGDEFLCVLPGLTQDETARRLAQARRMIAAECPGLTISIGIAERRPCEDADAIVSRADRALYVSRLLRVDR